MTGKTNPRMANNNNPKGPGKPGPGRPKGSPNKVTTEVRAMVAKIAERNIGNFEKWLMEVEEPAKRCDLFLTMLEYHVPKLARTELTGKDGKELQPAIVNVVIDGGGAGKPE